MTLIIELELDIVAVNQQVNNYCSVTHIHTHRIDCSTWTTKMGSKYFPFAADELFSLIKSRLFTFYELQWGHFSSSWISLCISF